MNERILVSVLRITGCVSLLAAIFVFVPYSWMNAIHQQLGMGELPSNPVVGYLARSTSAFYALLGGLLLVMGCGEDDSYECQTACEVLVDRWDDCTLDFHDIHRGSSAGSEGSGLNACVIALGEPLEDAAAEQAKLAICKELVDEIRGKYCGSIQEKVADAVPESWLEAMEAIVR